MGIFHHRSRLSDPTHLLPATYRVTIPQPLFLFHRRLRPAHNSRRSDHADMRPGKNSRRKSQLISLCNSPYRCRRLRYQPKYRLPSNNHRPCPRQHEKHSGRNSDDITHRKHASYKKAGNRRPDSVYPTPCSYRQQTKPRSIRLRRPDATPGIYLHTISTYQ